MKRINCYLLLILGLGLFSCQTETVSPDSVDLGYDYFPLSIGQVWEYEVNETNFGLLEESDTIFYTREEITDTVTDGDELSYYLSIFNKSSLEDEWVLDSVWTMKRTSSSAIRVENNQRLLKLAFPLSKGKIWDENILNTSEANEGEVIFFDELVTIDGETYDNALKVQYEQETSFIGSKDQVEVYQKNVGLVYSYKENLSTQPGERTIGKITEKVLMTTNE
ncbi:MAG: hypothetical protein GY827_06010 [Cytophagales bacterium]|nr:hypothetical protein [Cytophagales bacterium]